MSVKVTLRGSLLTGQAKRIMIDTVQEAIRQLVDMGEKQLDMMMRPRPSGVYLSVSEAKRGKASTGHFRRSLNKRVGRLHGILDTRVIYGPWLEGTSGRNQTTRFKGYAMFRRTAQYLQRQARGVMDRVHARLSQRLGA